MDVVNRFGYLEGGEGRDIVVEFFLASSIFFLVLSMNEFFMKVAGGTTPVYLHRSGRNSSGFPCLALPLRLVPCACLTHKELCLIAPLLFC